MASCCSGAVHIVAQRGDCGLVLLFCGAGGRTSLHCDLLQAILPALTSAVAIRATAMTLKGLQHE